MSMRLYNVIPQLKSYIKVICSIETCEGQSPLSSFRVVPDTCVELFINYMPSAQVITAGAVTAASPQNFIVSRMNRFMDVTNNSHGGFVAICFNPGAASHFFNIAMHEVSNTMIHLGDLWKQAAAEMEEQVMAAPNNEQRVSIIQQYLLQQLAKRKESDNTVEHWLWQVNFYKGQLPVKELSRKVNISQRQLARRFNQQIGLSPKEYARVARFIHSLSHLKKYPSVSLTEVAYESGYYDQAHFIHEYKEYTGYTPGELITAKNVLYC